MFDVSFKNRPNVRILWSRWWMNLWSPVDFSITEAELWEDLRWGRS